MRGKGVCRFLSRIGLGITPALAGKRTDISSVCARSLDHPRACGEKSPAAGITLYVEGSPPRLRGKEAPHITSPERDRITPALAGKSNGWFSGAAADEDHPRACGEKLMGL